VTLDSQQTDIRVNDSCCLPGFGADPFRVLAADHLATILFGEVPVSEDAVQPFILATKLTLCRSHRSPGRTIPVVCVCIQARECGHAHPPAKDRIELSDLDAGAALDGTVEPPQKEGPGSVQLRDADGSGSIFPRP
jgi:hypothetical protein